MLYFLFLAVIVTDIFIHSDVAMTLFFTVMNVPIFVALAYSMNVLGKLLSHLKNHGLHIATKTITLQLTLFGSVCFFSLIYFGTFLKFLSDCNDDKMAESWAASVTRAFEMAGLLTWRLITLTMCVLMIQ